jgi:hypothetical protein
VRNVESKFRYGAHEVVLARAVAAGASDEGWLHQRDQFYEVHRGRLKLRTIEGRVSELIAYERDDTLEARVSEYARSRSKPRTPTKFPAT